MQHQPGSTTFSAMRRMLDGLPSMVAYWDTTQTCRFANQAYQRWFGIDPAELVGKRLRDLLGPALYALNEAHILGALRGDEQRFERLVPGPRGQVLDSQAHYVPDIEDGRVLGFVAYVVDISQLKESEEALRQRQAALSEAQRVGQIGSWEWDAERDQTTWSDVLFGIMLARSPGQAPSWAEQLPLYTDESFRLLEPAVARALQTAEPYVLELEIVRPDGASRVWIEARGEAWRHADGRIGGLRGTAQDITERKLAEIELGRAQAALERTGRVAGVGGWEVDLLTGAIHWSARVREMHDQLATHMPNVENVLARYPGQAGEILREAYERALSEGVGWDLELPFISAKGRPRWVRSVAAIEREGGQPVRLVGALQDITEQRRHRAELKREQELRQILEQRADELSRLLHERTEMLDVLAHEVRQPLNNTWASLRSAVQVLHDAGEDVALPRLHRADRALESVLAGLDNTLAAAAQLAGSTEALTEDTDIDTLLAVAIADMPRDEQARIRIERATTTRTAAMDMGLMRLALRNLLSNALRYGEYNGPVVVRVRDSDQPLALVIDVEDRGSGFAPEELQRLFQRHKRSAQGYTQRQAHGLGLGLHIVRRVMEVHGGSVELVRHGPDGVTMRLVLSQERSAAPQA